MNRQLAMRAVLATAAAFGVSAISTDAATSEAACTQKAVYLGDFPQGEWYCACTSGSQTEDCVPPERFNEDCWVGGEWCGGS